jgi:hypothetical protein
MYEKIGEFDCPGGQAPEKDLNGGIAVLAAASGVCRFGDILDDARVSSQAMMLHRGRFATVIPRGSQIGATEQ